MYGLYSSGSRAGSVFKKGVGERSSQMEELHGERAAACRRTARATLASPSSCASFQKARKAQRRVNRVLVGSGDRRECIIPRPVLARSS